jgi:hypothetical protein
MRNYNNHNFKLCSLRRFTVRKPAVISKALRSDTRFPATAATCGGRDPSEGMNIVGEICVSGKWETFLMSRCKFRNGKNKRKETCLSAVGRKKINTNKLVLRLI